jgi:hypothetical protein
MRLSIAANDGILWTQYSRPYSSVENTSLENDEFCESASGECVAAHVDGLRRCLNYTHQRTSCSSPRWCIRSAGGTILTGGNRKIRRKSRPSATLSTTNPTWTGSDLRGETPTVWAMVRSWSNFILYGINRRTGTRQRWFKVNTKQNVIYCQTV